MPVQNCSKSARQKLNKQFIPDITEPYHIKIHWLRAVLPLDASVFLSREMHIHTFFELHLISDGKFDYSTSSGKSYSVPAGSGLMIPPENGHIIKSYSKTSTKFTIGFTPDKTSPLFNKLKSKGVFEFTVSEKIYSLLSDILSESEKNTVYSPYLIRNKIFEILCLLQREAGIAEEIPDTDTEIEDRRITAAKLYIIDNKERFITCEEVSSHCSLSTKQMERLFYSSTGRHLSEYIKSVRLSEAERLLSETKIPIKEISDSLGFSNVYNFTNFFTKKAGVTPAAFRKNDMNKENENTDIPYTL